MTSLNGQVALVTGATRGIGRAIAMRLGKEGATVVGTATSDGGATEIQRAFDGAGLQGWGIKLDVTDAAGCEAAIAAIEKRYAPVTVLVNNAGVTRDNLAMRMKDDEWDAVIDTNLKAVFRLSKLVMRGMMKARHGRIINITSVVGSSGNPGQANYTAAKAGVAGLTRSLAQELGSRNITVNCIAPGLVRTDMARALWENPDTLKASTAVACLKRIGEPHEIAGAAVFLASKAGAFTTGQTIVCDGGATISGGA